MEQEGLLFMRLGGAGAEYRCMMETGTPPFILPPELENAVDYLPEENQDKWYRLTDLKHKTRELPPRQEVLRNQYWILMNSIQRYEPQYIAFDDGKGYVFFQRMKRAKYLRNQRMLLVTEKDGISRLELTEPQYGFILGNEPDAIYDREKDTLYFKRLWGLNGLFPGLIRVYWEENEKTVKRFLSQKLVGFVGNFSGYAIQKRNMDRLNRASDVLENLTPEKQKEMEEYILKIFPELYHDPNSGCIAVETNENLAKVLSCVEQNFYPAPVTGELRQAVESFAMSEGKYRKNRAGKTK